jgi:predicted component of viral defense system (DUF524 family)
MTGKRFEDTPNKHHKKTIIQIELFMEKSSNSDVPVPHNPYLFFIRRSFEYLNGIMMEFVNFRTISAEFPGKNYKKHQIPSEDVQISELFDLGNLQEVFEIINEWTGEAVELSLDATKVIKLTKDFTNFLETTQMHIFLAAWTLWSGYQEPYIVDIFKRAPTLAAFQMIVTEDFVGLFYMVFFYT